MNYKILHDNILVELENVENTTASGLITGEEKQKDRGTILAVGDAVTEVFVGEKVVFKPGEEERIEIDGKKCVMIGEAVILAVIDG